MKQRLTEPQPEAEHEPAAVAVAAPPAPVRAPSVRDVMWLQAAVGNRAVQRLLRQPVDAPEKVKPKTDEELWQEDWDNAAYSGARKHFAGPDRPAGTPEQRYKHLAPMYKAHGIARPLPWIAANIKWGTFFGHGTYLHKDLEAGLKKAEKALNDAGVKDAPFKKLWAFNARTQTGDKVWSNHADGRAIDFDEVTNPRLLNKGHQAVISALTEMDITAANPGAAEGLDSYEASKLASERFQARYSVEGMTDRIEELGEEEAALLEEKGELADELKGVPTKKPSKDDVKKAKALKAQIAAKQAEINAKINARKALEKERKRFEAIDKAVADVEAAITKLEGEIDQLDNDVEKLEKGESLDPAKAPLKGNALKKEIRTRKGLIATKSAAIKRQQKKLADATKARDTDTLRGYADRGFLDLDKDLVEALKKAGLGWGGDYTGAKDFMHFEVK